MTSVPAPLEFRIPSGNLVPTRLLDVARTGETVIATIEVGQEEWTLIDLVMLFNLRWDTRNPGEVSGDSVVRIRMRLDPSLTSELQGDDVAAALTTPVEDPLRSTTSWYGLEVTEEVPLPPDLAGKGELRQGFTTTWGES